MFKFRQNIHWLFLMLSYASAALLTSNSRECAEVAYDNAPATYFSRETVSLVPLPVPVHTKVADLGTQNALLIACPPLPSTLSPSRHPSMRGASRPLRVPLALVRVVRPYGASLSRGPPKKHVYHYLPQ